MRRTLESERPLRVLPESELDRSLLRGYSLLSDTPLLAVLNREEDDTGASLPDDREDALPDELEQALPDELEDALARTNSRTR